MAKHDWNELKKEFLLGKFKSIREFCESKNIADNGNTKKHTKGWKDKKALNENKKSTKIMEKVIEKQAEKEAQNIVDLKQLGNDLASKIQQSMGELDRHLARNKIKTKTIVYNDKIAKPTKETIEEKETITDYISIIDRNGLKQLTSALKDIKDVMMDKGEGDEETLSKLDKMIEGIDYEAKR